MGKNVFNYLGIGFKNSWKKFKFKSNLLGYWFYLIAKLLSVILMIFYPIISFAKIQLGTKENKRVNILDAFFTADEPKTYWSSMSLILLKFLLFLSGFLIVGIFGALIFGIGFMISPDLMLYFAIPFVVFELIYIVLFFLYLFPATYYASKNISVSDSLRYSMNTMKTGGKAKVFFLSLFSILLQLITLAIPAGTIVSVILFVEVVENYYYIIFLVLIILFFLVYPYISFAVLSAKVELMHDLGINEEILLKEDKKSVEEEKIATMFNEFLHD